MRQAATQDGFAARLAAWALAFAAAQRAARQLAADFVRRDDKNPYFSNAARTLLAAAVFIVSMECPDPAGRNVASTLMTGITVLGDEGVEWCFRGRI